MLGLRIDDDQGRREVSLDRRVATVGSGEACNLRLEAAGVAEVHALLYRTPQGQWIKPAAGTPTPLVLVNDQRVSEAGRRLHLGDRVQLGAARLLVEPAAGQRPAPAIDEVETGAAVETVYRRVADTLIEQLQAFSCSVQAGERWPRPAEALLGSLARTTGAERGFLILLDRDGPRVVAAHPQVAEPAAAAELLSDRIVEQVLGGSGPIVVDDAVNHPTYASAPSVIRLELSSVLCAPLVVGEQLKGALYLGHSRRPGLFGASALELTQLYCAHAVLLLDSARFVAELRRDLDDARARLEVAARRRIIGDSAAMEPALRLLDRVAPTDLTVLIRGETGSGKELVARSLHEQSSRAAGPFVPIDCAAIPGELMESELFGHVRGAFTGADRDRDGLLVAASGGTLFLDEIGDLPLPLQPKLLRVLEDRAVRRIGEQRARPVDLRVVAASNRDLKDAGQFRPDLYFRLAQVTIELPPLRRREGDLDLLVPYFLGRHCAELQRPQPGISAAAWECLRRHRWPGNVRELQNRLHRALLLLGDARRVKPQHLGFTPDAPPPETLAAARDRFVARYVREVLARSGGNRAQAARALGIGLRSLYRYLRLDGDGTEGDEG